MREPFLADHVQASSSSLNPCSSISKQSDDISLTKQADGDDWAGSSVGS